MQKFAHDCGCTIIVRDKEKMNRQEVVDFLQKHLDVRLGFDWCELHYTKIKPRVMAESLIEMSNTSEFYLQTSVDHKIRCIEGKAARD